MVQTTVRAWTPAEAAAWAVTLYEESVDRKDAKGYAAAFVEDGWLRFGNNEPIVGRAAIEAAIAQFFSAFKSLQHEPTRTTATGSLLFLEATVTYVRHDGQVVSVPAMTVYEMAEMSDQPLVRRCNIYVDLAPLFAPAG